MKKILLASAVALVATGAAAGDLAGPVAIADVEVHIPVAIQESLRASLASVPADATTVVGDDVVEIGAEERRRLDPFLRRVAEELQARDAANPIARTDLVEEAVERARDAAQRAAGAAGTEDGGRLDPKEIDAIADADLRLLVRAAAVLAASPARDVRLAPAKPRPSNGAGGQTGRLEETFTDARGREGRVALAVPRDVGPKRSAGVLFYFHADGAEGKFASYADELEAAAALHGLMVASMQEPDEGAWWAPRTADNAAYVKEFLEGRLLKRYNIDRSRIFFSGESGGASFAGGLPARLGFAYGGGLLLASGGDVPRENGGDPDDDEAAPPPMKRHPAVPERARADFGAYFAIGTEDAELRNVLAAEAYLRRLGVKSVRHALVPGADHVEFSAVRAIADGLLALDGKR